MTPCEAPCSDYPACACAPPITETETLPEHSEHGASVCKRFWICPGSVALNRTLPDDTSPDAELGTAAHELAALCLNSDQDAIEYLGRTVHNHTVDAEMADHVQVYLDACRDVIKWAPQPLTVLVEHRFNLADLDPPAPMYGTADFVAVGGGWLFVNDLKYGVGVSVEAEGNPQLAYYALGALLSLPKGSPAVHTIQAQIIQPRSPTGRTHRTTTLDPEELVGWSIELMQHVKATLVDGAPLVPGDHCRDTFCKARFDCKARAEAALAVAGLEFVDDTVPVSLAHPDALSLADKSRALRLAPLLKTWLADLETSATADISRGLDVPGWCLVPTEARARWKDPAEAEAALDVFHELGEERFAPREILSPAKARDMLAERLPGKTKKAKRAAAVVALASLITTASSGTKLAPVGDGRLALPAAGSEFSEE